jgi:hypothetical protein
MSLSSELLSEDSVEAVASETRFAGGFDFRDNKSSAEEINDRSEFFSACDVSFFSIIFTSADNFGFVNDGDDEGDFRTRIFFFCGEVGEGDDVIPLSNFLLLFLMIFDVDMIVVVFFFSVIVGVVGASSNARGAATLTSRPFFFVSIVFNQESLSFFRVESSIVADVPATLFDLVGDADDEIAESNLSRVK